MKKIIYLFLIVHFTLNIDNCWSQWMQMNNGMGNLTVNALTSKGNYLFAGTTGQGVYISSNNGTTWTQASSLNNRTVWSFAANTNYVFAGTSTNGVYVSTDTTWVQTSLSSQAVRALAVGNLVFAGTIGSGLYGSSNNGVNWAPVPSLTGYIYALAVKAGTDTIFAGRYSGGPGAQGVYRSTNNGTNWTRTLSNQYIASLVVDGNDVFAGTYNPNNGVYLSTDGGTSWAQTSLNNQNVRTLAVDGNNVFAGTMNNGVYLSNDNGTTWLLRNEGLGNDTVYALCISNNYIFAGTPTGVYRRPLSDLITGIVPVSNQIPKEFSLSQNYPNPFNPSTVISYQLVVSSFTSLKIYDVLGKEVATLVSGQQKPGTYEVEFDGNNYPSGVYFYQLKSDNFSDTKKLILIK